MSVRLSWRGSEVLERVRAAEMAGVNKTMGECITDAKGLVHVDTGLLQGSISMHPAAMAGRGVVGQWGSFDVGYAIWQELLPGEMGRIKSGGKPYLRPSADSNYPHLAGHIREALL